MQLKWYEHLRYRGHSVYKASIDGVDFPIVEPNPFSSKWHSHKFHGARPRYEAGVAIGVGVLFGRIDRFHVDNATI